MSPVQVLLCFSPQQWEAITVLAERAGSHPADIVYRMLNHGWAAVAREIDGVPVAPSRHRLRLVK